jgi:hypothetical protein
MGKRKPPTNANGPAHPASPRMGSYFLSLSLENVRCFGPKQTLDLSDGAGKPARWTILVGTNGTGKTTVLQSLVGFEFLPGPRLPTGSEGWRDRLVNQTSEYTSSLVRVEADEAVLQARVGIARQHWGVCDQIDEYEHQVGRDLITTERSQLQGTSIEPPWCCGYGVSRRMGSGLLNDASSDDPTATLYSDRAELRNGQEWLLQLDYSRLKTTENQERWQHRQQQVEELLLRILPEITGVRYETSGEVYPRSRVEFETPYGWVPLRQLGYGYQTLITWVVDLASRMVERYPDSADPLAEPAFVAVDEIDLHLHPIWQRTLMNYLTDRFPNTQFVATAHSPLIVQAVAEDANLAVLRREGDHIVIDNNPPTLRNWSVDQVLLSGVFDLPSVRPARIDGLLEERMKLLTKAKLTPTDERRVKEIEEEIGELPTGETAQDIKDRQAIRQTLDLLMKERQPR